jgi:hypothetical protein
MSSDTIISIKVRRFLWCTFFMCSDVWVWTLAKKVEIRIAINYTNYI